MIDLSGSENGNESLFFRNRKKIEESISTPQGRVTRELLVAFLTIKSYQDLFYDPDIHLVNSIPKEFIARTMIPDLNRIILTLRDAPGEDRRGIEEALKLMDSALADLYKAGERIDLIDALLSCRGKLHAAYQHLEHLSLYLDEPPNPKN